jgi:hypothetical protein
MREPLQCRNCDSTNVVDTPSGFLDPFFVLRVIGQMNQQVSSFYDTLTRTAEFGSSESSRNAARLLLRDINQLPGVREAIAEIQPELNISIKVLIRICHDCSFIGPSTIYPFHQLIGLYRDYRSDSYNRDRCSVEPSYHNIMHLVGKSQQEVNARMANLDQVVDCHVDCSNIQTVLDWGGGEGRFVPTSLRSKRVTILDYSSEEPADPTFQRLSQLHPDQTYDYIQMCHVLEHVSEPRLLMLEAISHLNPGGVIYIELPQDRPDGDIQRFCQKPGEMIHTIHEHLNLYTSKSLERLAESCGLKYQLLTNRQLDFGWIRPTIISGLFLKPG